MGPMRGVPGRTGVTVMAAALVVAGGVASAFVISPSHPRSAPAVAPAAAPRPAPSTTASVPPTTVPGPPPSYIATLSAATAYSTSPGGPAAGTLSATNPFGAAQVLAVVGAPSGSGWLHVELPVRPNGTAGWIPAAGVQLTHTYYSVAVSTATRTLTVSDAGKPVLTTPVAVGAPGTPTPADTTYLWELIRPDDPTGPYGPYVFGLAEFSDTYAVFNGGDAQIGMHGNDEPWSIGEAASHGCIRLPNDVITRLAGTLPLGTPVVIS